MSLAHPGMHNSRQDLERCRERGLAPPAFRKALADQCGDIAAHGPEDMGWDAAIFADAKAS